MQGVLNAARKIDPQAKLSHLSVTDITFDPTLPPERYQLGCSPSMNAYDEPSVLMGTPELLPFRSAGWHMHFRGTTPPVNAGDPVDGFHSVDSKELAAKIIQLEDAILGTALVSFGQHHVDPRRRLMYGRAGEYRLGKTLEYRVPEVLMGCHPATWNLFWDLGRAVYWLGMRGFNFIWDADPTEVREAINNSNVALAQKILTKNIQVLNSIFKYLYRVGPLKPTPDWAPDKMAVKAILEGANAVLNDPTAVSRNWRLESGQTWQNESQGHLTGTNWRTSVPMLQRGEKL
jgi:hypothetical protein